MADKSFKTELEETIRHQILDDNGNALQAAQVPVWAVNRVSLDCATNAMRALRTESNWRTDISPDSSEGMEAIPETLRAKIRQSAMTAAERVMKGSIN